MRYLNYSVILVFAIGLFALNSCDRRSCEDVICNANNSTCVDGRCVCAAGYEGENCDQLSYQKYVGSYQISQSCTSSLGGGVAPQWSSASISQSSRIDIIRISNFAGQGFSVDAQIVDGDFIYITDQNLGSIEVSGGEGEFNNFNNTIVLEYQYRINNTAYNCRATFIPF